MKGWLRGLRGGLLVFLVIAALVAGGLGWATLSALRLEREQVQARIEAEHAGKVRLALWRLDRRSSDLLAVELTRPYNHYSAIYHPSQTIVLQRGRPAPNAVVLELSPLLNAELPDWMLLHFQADDDTGWGSPQVPFPTLAKRLELSPPPAGVGNVTPERNRLLTELKKKPARNLIAAVASQGREPSVADRTVVLMASNSTQLLLSQNPNPPAANPPGGQQGAAQQFDPEAFRRFEQQQRLQTEYNNGFRDNRDAVFNNLRSQGSNWLSPGYKESVSDVEVGVTLSPMAPVWMTLGEHEYLLLARQVRIEEEKQSQICQGIVLDPTRLRGVLLQEIRDLFPDATLEPVREPVASDPERTMAALPFRLEAGSPLAAGFDPGWTPLRIGLVLAWAAAVVALLAVGLGGWSLLNLSERRFRFVSAVTHELRTPLTTLKLYLDMLTGGMVKDEQQREEYLRTLNAEADRLGRLVTNVLDFSRLEKQRPRLSLTHIPAAELLETVHETWRGRCQDAGKELVIENGLPEGALVTTDADLVQQVLANLIDNACKYSRESEDNRVWLRARQEHGRLVLEVEDRGPGVPVRERRTIFRPFRRGENETTGGGVGLGLSLARRWTGLLGGQLTLHANGDQCGACFRVELPTAEHAA